MAKENEINSTEVQINGKKYYYNDLSEEQIYLLRQTQSCRVKINNLKFIISQTTHLNQAFEYLLDYLYKMDQN